MKKMSYFLNFSLTIFLAFILSSCSKSVSDPQKICIENKVPSEQILCLNELIIKEPGNYEAHKYLVGAYNLQVQYDKAIETLDKMLTINPKDIEVYEKLGGYYIYYKQYDKAIQSFEKGSALGNLSGAGFFNMGMAYLKNNNYAKAKEALNNAKKVKPELENSVNQAIKQIEQYETST